MDNLTTKISNEEQNHPSCLGAGISRFVKFLYWFTHNEVATPLLIIALIIAVLVVSPFYLICNYFYRYYYRINGLQR